MRYEQQGQKRYCSTSINNIIPLKMRKSRLVYRLRGLWLPGEDETSTRPNASILVSLGIVLDPPRKLIAHLKEITHTPVIITPGLRVI